MELLKENDFVWKIKKINNIKSNPIEYIYTTYNNNNTARKYYIVPQYSLIDEKYNDLNSEPELYIYFESTGLRLKDGEEYCKYSSIMDVYKYEKGTFKRAFKSIEEAKHRAYIDYYMIYCYVKSFTKQ